MQWWDLVSFPPRASPSPLPSAVAVVSTGLCVECHPVPGMRWWHQPDCPLAKHVQGNDRHPGCAHPTKIAANYESSTSHFLSSCGGEHRRSCMERWHLLRALAQSGLRWKLSGRIKLRVSALAWGWHRGSSAELPCSLSHLPVPLVKAALLSGGCFPK